MGFKNQTVAKITSWTPTKLELYEGCPRKAKYKFIDKLPEPPPEPGSPLERGTEIHESAEGYVTSRSSKLHEGLKNAKVKKLLNLLKKDYKLKKVRVELELAFNQAWKPVGWLAKDVYCRFKIDVLHLLKDGAGEAIDWKTGRFKPEGKYDDQLNAYSVAALSTGLVKSVTSKLVFTDHGEVVDVPAGRLAEKDLAKSQKIWDKKAKAMLSDTKFAPRPGVACKWCPYSTNRGGPCEF